MGTPALRNATHIWVSQGIRHPPIPSGVPRWSGPGNANNFLLTTPLKPVRNPLKYQPAHLLSLHAATSSPNTGSLFAAFGRAGAGCAPGHIPEARPRLCSRF